MLETLTPVERRWGLALVLAFLVIYLLPLGVRPLAVPDEARYGEIAREMIAGGDWVSPRFNGVRYFEKPILGHWADAASIALFGENPFAVRLPEALATGLTALLIFLFMARFATPRQGLIASGIYLSCLEVLGVGTFAVLDPLLTLFLTAAVMAYYAADRASEHRQRFVWLGLCGVACGAAFLAKGFLAYAVPVLVIAPYLVSERAWGRLAASGWLPLAVSAAVAAPWGLAIHAREPDFWHYFFFVEHLQRFAADNAQHPQPPWYFLVLLPLLAFPWIYFAPAFRRLDGAPWRLVKLLLLWIVMPLVFFSLARGKLATYVLPCFPPFAMLAAVGLERYLATPATRALRAGLAILIALDLLGLVLLAASRLGFAGEPIYGSGEAGREALVYGAYAVALALALSALTQRGRRLALPAIAAAVLPLYTFGTLALPARIRDMKTPEPFLEASAASIDPDTILIADGDLFGALAWFAERDDVYLLLGHGEISYGLSYPDAAHRYLDAERFAALLAAKRSSHAFLIFATRESAVGIEPLLPAGTERSARGDFVLWRIPEAGGDG